MSQPNLDQALKLFSQVENELTNLQSKMQEIKQQLASAQSELNYQYEHAQVGLKNDKKFVSVKKVNQRLLEQLNDLQRKYHAMLDQINYLHMEFAVYSRLIYENWLSVADQEQKELQHQQELTKLREKAAPQPATQLEDLARKLRLTPYRS